MSVPAVSAGQGNTITAAPRSTGANQHRSRNLQPFQPVAAVTFLTFTSPHAPSKANHSHGNPRAFHQPQRAALSTERKSCLL